MSTPPHKPDPLGERALTDVTYTHSTLVMPSHTNTLGVMHGGWLMSWMDMAAWVVAARAVAPDQAVYFKAASEIVMSAPVHAGEVCAVTATLSGIGRSSIAVALIASAENPVTKTTRRVCTSTFTMVAGRDGASEPLRLVVRTSDAEG